MYVAIDLKSFYASVECAERGLDPLTTNLVVADTSRTDKTICLAVSPSLKQHGIGGRARLFEVLQRLRDVNAQRQLRAPGMRFAGKSTNDIELHQHPEYAIDFIAAPPRMAHYIEYSTRIYNIYLRHFAPEDIHVYSIDEVFIDLTNYIEIYKTTAHQLTIKVIREVLKETGITATAGIGTNLFLAKVAMDIVAKHIPADSDGVRIAELDEASYRRKLWSHRPLTDFWRVGPGIARKLEKNEIYTMGMVARCSVTNEELLYKLFGVNAELLIDHAWGWEPTTIELIKQYRPESNSLSSGQVLQCPYTASKARIVALEMADAIALDLVEKQLVTDQMALTIGYDVESLNNIAMPGEGGMKNDIVVDYYGRLVPKPSHGSVKLPFPTSSAHYITQAIMHLFDKLVNPSLLVRRITIATNNVVAEQKVVDKRLASDYSMQLDLFTNYDQLQEKQRMIDENLKKERRMQETIIDIKRKFGKNAILKGLNYEDGATAKERNRQIGGHKA